MMGRMGRMGVSIRGIMMKLNSPSSAPLLIALPLQCFNPIFTAANDRLSSATHTAHRHHARAAPYSPSSLP
ncbi:hypothetical protein E2C01_038326 [Portunus trituberculatus]|uniref:Uncharacterized protein n=1 Tax=Portunus trituberculatus TaxID=210409 RepID=A0A5B7FHB2_PORTR|nr:hypothetical protein [Portunus trituberculatus]